MVLVWKMRCVKLGYIIVLWLGGCVAYFVGVSGMLAVTLDPDLTHNQSYRYNNRRIMTSQGPLLRWRQQARAGCLMRIGDWTLIRGRFLEENVCWWCLFYLLHLNQC